MARLPPAVEPEQEFARSLSDPVEPGGLVGATGDARTRRGVPKVTA